MPNSVFDSAKLSAGRLWACNRWSYFTTGLLALDVVPMPGLGTFAIDRHWRVYIDPEVVENWTVADIGIVLNLSLIHI